MSKHMVLLRDPMVQECVQFLEHCEGESRLRMSAPLQTLL